MKAISVSLLVLLVLVALYRSHHVRSAKASDSVQVGLPAFSALATSLAASPLAMSMSPSAKGVPLSRECIASAGLQVSDLSCSDLMPSLSRPATAVRLIAIRPIRTFSGRVDLKVDGMLDDAKQGVHFKLNPETIEISHGRVTSKLSVSADSTVNTGYFRFRVRAVHNGQTLAVAYGSMSAHAPPDDTQISLYVTDPFLSLPCDSSTHITLHYPKGTNPQIRLALADDPTSPILRYVDCRFTRQSLAADDRDSDVTFVIHNHPAWMLWEQMPHRTWNVEVLAISGTRVVASTRLHVTYPVFVPC